MSPPMTTPKRTIGDKPLWTPHSRRRHLGGDSICASRFDAGCSANCLNRVAYRVYPTIQKLVAIPFPLNLFYDIGLPHPYPSGTP